ncbi:MAG: transglycosylase SLT domain-containing protein [Dehalococcoidia bacterium]
MLTGAMPSAGGFALVAWSGGKVEEVRPAAAAAGCDATSVWVSEDGELIGYAFAAPTFVNAEFLGIADGGDLAPDSLLVLVCRSGPTSVPTASMALEAPNVADYLLSSAELAQYGAAVNSRDAGRYDQATAQFGQLAVGDSVLAPVAMMRAGQMLVAADRDAEAVEAFRLALDMRGLPGPLAVVARLDAANALRALHRDAEVLSLVAGVTPGAGGTSSQVAQALWLEAQAKRDLRDPAWTSDALTIVSTYPSSGDAPLALDALEHLGAAVPALQAAYVRYRHGQNAAALATYQRAAAGSDADAPVAWFYLGALAERAGDRVNAIAAYNRSIQLDPTGALADDSYWWAAHVLNVSGQRAQAADHWATLASRFPSSPFAPDAAVRAALVRAGLNDFDAAAGVLRTMLDQSAGASAARASRWLRVLDHEAASPAQFDARSISAILEAAGDSATAPLPAASRAEWGTDGSADWSLAAAWMRARYGAAPVGDVAGADTVRIAFGLARAGEALVARTLLYAHINSLADRPYDLLTLSRLAAQAGLHDVSIAAANRLVAGLSPAQRLLTPFAIEQLIYPTAFATETLAAARAEGIPPLLLSALVRRESLFQPTAGSPVGARGLAQIMPATGREIAASLGVRWDPAMLLDPATSLRFGAHYLATQLERFDGDVWRSLAAYNGGPGNASRWFRAQMYPGADWYIEAVDYAETRLYLRVVMEEYAWYRYLYAGAAAPTMH